MALNLADRLVVIQSRHMQVRVTAAVSQYALYLLGNVGATTPQLAWAKGAMDGLESMGSRVGVHLLDDPNFLSGGSDITDVQIQGAVETAVNSRFIAAG